MTKYVRPKRIKDDVSNFQVIFTRELEVEDATYKDFDSLDSSIKNL
jgi:hypothetical protein